MKVMILPSDKDQPAGKLADAELVFEPSDGPLDGLRLIGFGIWRRGSGPMTVTWPSRQYNVNGERRSFALLRPVESAAAQNVLRDVILAVYDDFPKG